MKLCGHFCSCSSNGRLRSFLTPRRSSCDHPWISFSIAYNAAIRSSASAATADLCVTECRRTSSVGAPNKPLLDPLELLQVLFWMFSLAIRRVSEPYRRWCGISRWSIVSHIRPQPSGLGLAQARRQRRHPHATYRLSSPAVAALHTAAPSPSVGWFPPPSPPKSRDPVLLLHARRSLPAGTREDDPHTSRPVHGPTALAPPYRVRWASSALSLARSCRGSSQLDPHLPDHVAACRNAL